MFDCFKYQEKKNFYFGTRCCFTTQASRVVLCSVCVAEQKVDPGMSAVSRLFITVYWQSRRRWLCSLCHRWYLVWAVFRTSQFWLLFNFLDLCRFHPPNGLYFCFDSSGWCRCSDTQVFLIRTVGGGGREFTAHLNLSIRSGALFPPLGFQLAGAGEAWWDVEFLAASI